MQYSANYLNTPSGLIVSFILFFIGLILVRLTHQQETLGEQFQLFIVGYLARMAMILLIYNGGLIAIVTDADSSGWFASLYLYDQWLSEGYGPITAPIALLNELNSNRIYHAFYKLVYAMLFLMTGLPGRISAASINALFGALIPVFSYRMSLQIFGDPKAARYLGWTLALMPSMLVFSSLTAKESFVVFFEVLGLYCCVQIAQRRFRLRHIIAFTLCTYFMQYLRFYISNVLVGSFIVALAVPLFVRGRYRKSSIALGLMLAPLVMYVGFKSAMNERSESNAQDRFSTIGGLKAYSKGLIGNSYVENPFDITQPSQFVPGLLFGTVHLLYAPFPWNLLRGSSLMLLTTPEVLWWYYVGTIRLVRGLRYGLRENLTDSLIPILFCLPLIYYYSLIFANIGLSYRYRAQIYPELLLFIAFGYKRLHVRHGYQSYTLPEAEKPGEYLPEQMPYIQRQPRIARDRFNDGEGGFRPAQWQDRNNRFGRM